MMTRAQLAPATKRVLWAEAIHCANTLMNISSAGNSAVTPFEAFVGRRLKLYNHLIEFGRIGYVTTRGTFRVNWNNRAIRGIMVGYCENKPADTYQIY